MESIFCSLVSVLLISRSARSGEGSVSSLKVGSGMECAPTCPGGRSGGDRRGRVQASFGAPAEPAAAERASRLRAGSRAVGWFGAPRRPHRCFASQSPAAQPINSTDFPDGSRAKEENGGEEEDSKKMKKKSALKERENRFREEKR